MDVTLPNGKVIRGVPEGTSKEEIMQKAIAAGLAVAEDFPEFQAAAAPQQTPGQIPPDQTPPGPGPGPQQPTEQDLFRESSRTVIPEVVGGLVSDAFAQIASGLAGAVTAPFVGIEEALENMESVKEAFTFETRGDIAKQARGFIDDLGAMGVEVGNKSLSGLIALSALSTGQPLEAAVSQQQAVEEGGFSNFLGDSLLEAGAPPEVAAFAKGVPTATLAALGFRVKAGPAARQPSKKELLAERVRAGSTDVETTGLMPKPERRATDFDGSNVRPLEAPTQGAGGQPSRLPQPDAATIIKDPLAIAAVKQGFDPGVVNSSKQASPATKEGLLEMTAIKKKGLVNRRYEAKNRPSDVVGDSLLERYKVIRQVNREAGARINAEAKKLKGMPVDSTPAVDNFLDALGEMGIELDAQNQPIFQGSDIEGSTPSMKVVTNVVKRMRETKEPDAHDLHRLKRYIDEQVTYGKGRGGDLGRIENVLKDLRRDIDGILDDNFPDYNDVNTLYSETIGVLDELQDIAGRKTNLLGANSAKGVGVLLRRVLSNAVSRTRLLDSLDSIEGLARRLGGGFEDDLLDLVLYANELDNRFGASAATSFKGEIERAIPISKTDMAVKTAKAAAEKLRGINNEAAFKSIEDLLKR